MVKLMFVANTTDRGSSNVREGLLILHCSTVVATTEELHGVCSRSSVGGGTRHEAVSSKSAPRNEMILLGFYRCSCSSCRAITLGHSVNHHLTAKAHYP